MPLQRAGVGIERDERRVYRLSPGRFAAVEIRIGVAGAPIHHVQLGIVGARQPRRRAAALPGVGRPRVAARFARRGNRPEPPRTLAGLHVVRIEEAADRELAAGDADDDLVLDDERRAGAGVAGLVIGHLHVPDHLAGLHIERHEVGIERGHEEPVAVDSEAAIHEAAADLHRVGRRQHLAVLPDLTAGLGVDRPRVVERARHVDDPVDDDRRRLELAAGRTAVWNVHCAESCPTFAGVICLSGLWRWPE